MNTKKINLLPVLQQATEETNVLVEQNGTASRIPADVFSGDRLIEKLTPAFTKTALTVKCNPVEGYPLDVISYLAESKDDLLEGLSVNPDTFGYDVDLPAGKYKLRVESRDENYPDVYWLYANNEKLAEAGQGETTFMHSGGELCISHFEGAVNSRLTLTKVAQDSTCRSVTLTHCEKTYTQAFPQDANGGYFHWSTGELFVPKENLIPVDLSVAENWGMEESAPVYYLPALPAGTYTLLTAEDTGISVEFERDGAWVQLASVGISEKVTFEHTGGNIRLSDYDWDVVIGSVKEVRLVAGREVYEVIQLPSWKILGLPGENRLCSSIGSTMVSGRADPNFIVQELAAQVKALVNGDVYN